MQLALNVNFGSGFTDAIGRIITFIPRLIGFLVILAIGWIIAKAIEKVVDRVLRKLGTEKVAERAGMGRMLGSSKYDTTMIISKIIYYAILLMVLQLAFGVFGPNPISVMIHAIVAWLPRGIVAVVIMIVAMAIANAARNIVSGALSGTSYGRVLGTVCWGAIVAIGALAALGQAGIATTVIGPILWMGLAAVAGIAIVGVGGGLINPMRSRCERWLTSAERESANARGSISAYQAGRGDALAGRPAETPQETGQSAQRPHETGGEQQQM